MRNDSIGWQVKDNTEKPLYPSLSLNDLLKNTSKVSAITSISLTFEDYDIKKLGVSKIRSIRGLKNLMVKKGISEMRFHDQDSLVGHPYFPAIIRSRSYSHYARSILHNDYGPAYVSFPEHNWCHTPKDILWVRNGYYHNTRGPAKYRYSHRTNELTVDYYIDGVKLSETQFNQWSKWYYSSRDNENVPWDWGLMMVGANSLVRTSAPPVDM